MHLLKLKKIISLLSCTIALCSLMILDVSFNAEAVSYKDKTVGYITESNAKKLNKTVNKKIIDDEINVKRECEISPAIVPATSFTDVNEVSNKILNESEAEKDYCLVIDGVVYFHSDNQEDVQGFVDNVFEFAKKKYKSNNIISFKSYEIQNKYFVNCRNFNYEQMLSVLNIKCFSTEQQVKKTKINYKTKYVYSEGPDKVVKKGKFGRLKSVYENTYINSELQSSMLSSEVVEIQPCDKVIATNNIDKLDENTTLVDSNILPVYGTQKEFIDKVLPNAVKGYKTHHILPSLTLAQSILESAWGNYSIGNNLFGIKAYSDWKGKVKYVSTKEQNNDGSYKSIKTYFRDYDSYGESVNDYLDLLNNPRYAKVKTACTYKDAAYLIQLSGYATSHNYAENLIRVIEQYQLYKWDKVNYAVEDSIYKDEVKSLIKAKKEKAKKDKEKKHKNNKQNKMGRRELITTLSFLFDKKRK